MSFYDVLYVLTNVVLAHIISRFIYLFYEKCRVNKYIEFLVYFIYFIFITFVFMYFGNPIITVIFNLLSIFLFTLLYDYINIRKGIIVTLIIYLFLFLLEVSVLLLASVNGSYFSYLDEGYRNILVLTITHAIAYIVYFFLLSLRRIYIRKLELIISNKLFIVFGIYSALSILIIFINCIINDDLITTVLINIVIVFLNMLIFEYCDFMLRCIYEKIFGKFLYERFSVYKKEIRSFEKNSNSSVRIFSGNEIIDSILNSKICILDSDISLKFEISIKDNLNIKPSDLMVIIGNLMDNAILGLDLVSSSMYRYMYMKIRYINGMIIFSVKNSFNKNAFNKNLGIVFDVDKGYNYRLFVLSISEIAEKYNGTVDFKCSKNSFKIDVLIYDV